MWKVVGTLKGSDGRDGKDAPPVDVPSVVKEVVSLVPTPRDGRDGESVSEDRVRAIIAEEVAKQVAMIPVPRDGKDGTSIDVEEAYEFIGRSIDAAISKLPKPKNGVDGKDGRDGKDAEPIHPDTIALMVTREVQKAVDALPKPKDGARGEDGRDALDTPPIEIDETRSYPRGTYAFYDGGVIYALRATEPLKDSDIVKSGWRVAQQGVADIKIEQGEDPRNITVSIRMTGGGMHVKTFHYPGLLHKGQWLDGVGYVKGDGVTHNGSTWLCRSDFTKEKPGTCTDWLLIVKKGGDGKSYDPSQLQTKINPSPVRLK